MTCESTGSKIYSCTCGDSYGETIDALGHAMGQWRVQEEATCDMDGLKAKTCYREECDYAEYQIIEASGHGDGEWITLVEPTTEEEGVKERTCANCGNKEYAKIDKLEEQPPVLNNPFKDVKENDYFYHSVLWAVDYKITSGLSADMFAPNLGCTRAEVVTFLWRMENRPEPVRTENEFSDIAANAYYYKAVLWAVENGITAGYYQDLFAPDMSCTRCQVVSFLYRAYR